MYLVARSTHFGAGKRADRRQPRRPSSLPPQRWATGTRRPVASTRLVASPLRGAPAPGLAPQQLTTGMYTIVYEDRERGVTKAGADMRSLDGFENSRGAHAGAYAHGDHSVLPARCGPLRSCTVCAGASRSTVWS